MPQYLLAASDRAWRRRKVLELGLTDIETIRKRKKCFFAALLIGVIGLPILFIGIWNRVT